MGNEKKSNVIIVILALIIVFLLVLVVLLLTGTIKFNNDNDSTLNDNNKISGDISNKSEKYVNYKSYDVNLHSRNTNRDLNMKLNVIDGELIAKLEEEVIPVNGINGEVKSFVFGYDCGSNHYILVITSENKVYFSFYDYDEFADKRDHALNFKEILADKNIVNITKINYAGGRTCGNHDFGVVLDNNEIRAIDSYNTDITIGDLDYSQIKYARAGIVIYSDNTFSELLDDGYNGPIRAKVSYDGENLTLEKYIVVKNNDGLSYVISGDKLYKLIWGKNESFTVADNFIDHIELVNDSKIDSESLSVSIGDNNFYLNEKSNIIRFLDGTSIEIADITYVYSIQ